MTQVNAHSSGKASSQPGVLRIGLWQEPDNINAYLTWMATGVWLGSLVLEPLVRPDAEGIFHPVLAERVPSLENGDIASDGLTITYHLRRDACWADGEPFTSRDVRATWEVLSDPSHQVISREGFEWIEAIDCPDEHTAVLRFSKAFPPFRVLFLCVYPEHKMRQFSANFNSDPFHRAPLGTGPYQLEEWKPKERLTFVANPRYRGPAPYFQRLDFLCITDRPTLISSLAQGDLDLALLLGVNDLPQVEHYSNLVQMVTPTSVTERVVFNLRHPALSDVRVRRALELATNKQQIVDTHLLGRTHVAASELDSTAWANPAVTPSRFSPAEAETLLDEAGWLRSSDGTRQKDGQRLSLVICATEGDAMRQAVEEALVQMYAAVGVELRIQNHRAELFFGNAADGGVLVQGEFDLAMRARGMWGDPDPNMSICYQSRWIPAGDNQGMGANFGGYRNPEVDAWLEEAQNTMDQERRHTLYNQVQQRIQEDVPAMYLFNLPNVDIARPGLRGLRQLPYINVWGTVWNAHEWTEEGVV
ncbi:MAG: peptide ABC transporter substrate-binding protein [Ktedonobacteraceae bacterium]